MQASVEKRNGVIRNTMRQILLYSGGLDSVASAFLHPQAALVYVNYNGKYCSKENKYIFEAANFLKRDVLVVKDVLNLSNMESGEGAFLPNRNAFLILAVINSVANKLYSEESEFEIILNATASGIHTDKDEIFAEKLSDLLNYMNRGGTDSASKTYKISLPTKHLTKPEIVHQYLAKGGNPEALITSVSCYDKEKRQCGECRSCCRKFFALKANNIDCNFSLSDETLKAVQKRCLNKTWCSNEKEMKLTLDVLKCV